MPAAFAPAVALTVVSPHTAARSVCLRAARAARAHGARALRLSAGAAGSGGDAGDTGDGGVPAGSVRLTLLGRSGVFNARAVILGVPFLWGSFPAAGKVLYGLPWAVPPVAFNALRLLLSALCVLPATVRDARAGRGDRDALLRAGAELGFWMFLGSTLQIVGLRYTSASKAAFLTQLQTVLVPVFAVAAGAAGPLPPAAWAASALALAGVGLLTLDDPAASVSLRGDGVMLLCAVVYACFVLRTRAVATRLRAAPLVAYKVTFQAGFALLLTLVTAGFSRTAASAPMSGAGIAAAFAGATPMLLLINVALVVWTGAFIAAMSTWLHVRAGAVVPAPETAVIFSFTPLVTALLSIFLGERFGIKGVLGGALIVLSTILSSRKPPSKGIPAVKEKVTVSVPSS